MNRFFSFPMFKEQLRRLKMPLLLVSTMSAFILVMMVVLFRIAGYSDTSMGALPSVWPLGLAPFVSIFFLEVLLKDYRTRNGSDYYHALPVKRQSVLISAVLATVCCIVFYMIVPSIIQIVVSFFMGYERYTWDTYFDAFIYGVLVTIYFCGGLLLGHCLTGKRSSHYIVTAVIMFGPRLFFLFIAVVISETMPYLLLNRWELLFDPEKYNLLISYMAGNGATATAVIYTMLLTLVYFVLALFLVDRRPSETAGSPTWTSKMETAVRVILSCALCIPSIISVVFLSAFDRYSHYLYGGDVDLYVIVFFYLLAVIVYFMYEIVQTRKFKASFKHWKGLGWVVLFNVLTIAGILILLNNVRNKRPSADEIASVSIIEVQGDIFDDSGSSYNISQKAFPDKENEKVFESLIYEIPLDSEELRRAVAEELDYSASHPDRSDYGYGYISTVDFQALSLNIALQRGDTYSKMTDDTVNTIIGYRKVGLKIRLVNGQTIYRKLILSAWNLREILDKPEFTRRLGQLDLSKMAEYYKQKIGKADVLLNVNNIWFQDVSDETLTARYIIRMEEPLETLQEDFRSLSNEQKFRLLFECVESSTWEKTYRDQIMTGCLHSNFLNSQLWFSITPELTPSTYALLMDNERVQMMLEIYGGQDQTEGGDADVSD